MDIFNEQLVLRKKSPVESAFKYGVFACAALLIFILVVFGSLFFMGKAYAVFVFVPYMAAVGVYYLAKKWYGALDIEFEYSLTNGQFDVDKIINRSDRSRMITFECKDIDTFAKYDSSVKVDLYNTRIFAANADSENLYYFVIKANESGKTIVVIEPNEKMLEGIKRSIPRNIYFDVFGRN
ncbi:MAG: hypothetical protein IJE65_01315 [Clostridia bacterium]|nr:hypothetical protein [Clostridia bacterium]